MRRLITLAIGVVLGVFLAGGVMALATRLQAQPSSVDLRRQFENQPAARLIEIPAPRGQSRVEGVGQSARVFMAPPSMVFLKDLKTDGCWLAYMGSQNEPVAIAVAPANACQQ